MEIEKRSKKRGSLVALASVVLLAAARPAGPLLDILPLADVRPGMKGYGLTVASGDAIERFGVEVIGVVPNATPGRTSILVRLSGLGLEESGIVAGMSGSPVYLEGRLAGAVATGWGFTKGPIGGVTPIEAMLAAADDGKPEAVPAASSAAISPGEVARALAAPQEVRLEALGALAARLKIDAPAGGSFLLSPLASGIPAETLERHRASFAALLPMGVPAGPAPGPAAAATRIPPRPLQGGSAITALLIDGDLQLGATGTVTAVLPDGRFVAFGHPFLGMGEVALPVAEAHVVSVLPNIYQSFKVAWAGPPSWRLTRDRDTGVTGATDRPAPMVPVKLRFRSENVDRTFSFRVAPHPRLLPALVGLGTDAALSIADPTPRDRTIRFRIAYATAAGEVAYEDVASGSRARDLTILTATVLGNALEENELGEPGISAIDLSVVSEPGERRLRVVSAALSRTKVHPGETLAVTVRLADRRGEESVKTLHVTVPKQIPEGRASLLVADGGTASAMRLVVEPAEPRTLEDLKRLLARLVPTDKLFTAILVGARGSATGPRTLSALPPTAAALLSEPAEGTESLRNDVPARLLAEEIVPFDRPVSGSARLELEIERSRF